MRNKLLLLLPVTLALQPALAAAAPISTRGIVVQRDMRGGALVLAAANGSLQRVSTATPGRFAMGAIVRMRGSRITVLGRAHHAKLHGFVLHRTASSFALANGGTVLSVTAPSPPAPGGQVTTNVQIGQSALSDDDDAIQENTTQAPSVELHGTVLAQTATTLQLGVPGFPAGLTVQVGSVTVPTLATGTVVDARVSLGPDPANAAGIVLTLTSLHVEGSSGAGQTPPAHSTCVSAEGTVTAVTEAGPTGGATGSITIAGEHGSVTYTIPAGFGPTGVQVGDTVEARGTAGAAGATPTLTKLESSSQGDDEGDDDNDNGGQGHHDHHHRGGHHRGGGSWWKSGHGGNDGGGTDD